jgi:hypothetical protein
MSTLGQRRNSHRRPGMSDLVAEADISRQDVPGARTAILDKAPEVALRTMAPEMIILDRMYMFVPFQSDATFRTEAL